MPETTPTSTPDPYMVTIGGRRYSYLHPTADTIDIEDIIFGLHQYRWTGHHGSWVTILEHSYHTFLIAKWLGETNQRVLRTALMHDAHEAYVGDVAGPCKKAMRLLVPSVDPPEQRLAAKVGIPLPVPDSPWDIIEARAMAVVALKYDLIYPHPPIVREADNLALAWEWRARGLPDSALDDDDQRDRYTSVPEGMPHMQRAYEHAASALRRAARGADL